MCNGIVARGDPENAEAKPLTYIVFKFIENKQEQRKVVKCDKLFSVQTSDRFTLGTVNTVFLISLTTLTYFLGRICDNQNHLR